MQKIQRKLVNLHIYCSMQYVMAIGRRRTREGVAYHSAIRWEHVEQECPSTSNEAMQWKVKTEEREKRLGMFGYKLSC